jgi:ribonuclease P protein component
VLHLAAPDDGGAAVPATVGFVVSRQVGPAVVRNRVRRRLRHLMADRVSRLDPGSRAVVRANPAAATATFRTLEAELDAALARVARGGAR